MPPKPAPNPDNEPKEVQEFRKNYAVALERARVSAAHTDTEGWQDLYSARTKAVAEKREAAADGLARLGKAAAMRLLDGDELKELKDFHALLGDALDDHHWFQKNIIDPILEPMKECGELITIAIAEAQAAERAAPLHARGILEIMQTVIDTVPRVKFLTKSGRVVVGEGN